MARGPKVVVSLKKGIQTKFSPKANFRAFSAHDSQALFIPSVSLHFHLFQLKHLSECKPRLCFIKPQLSLDLENLGERLGSLLPFGISS